MSLALETARALAPLTSLGLGGPAEYFASVEARADLHAALAFAREQSLRTHVLGGGSNLVVSDSGVRGLVLRMATRGMVISHENGAVFLTAEAGEPFENVVERAVAADLAGLECLTGIPGSTGATPIQNVGAYGQEVSDAVDAVEVLDRTTGEVSWLSAGDCAFGYRTSRFKRDPERFIVLSVRFRLRPQGAPSVRYAELLRALPSGHEPTLREVSGTVRALRAKKSMLLDPSDPNGRSAGSFFTNPVVSEAEAERVRRTALERGMVASASDVPSFTAGPGEVKLAAGWLIEKSGISKGFARDGVGVSSAHALCLVHRGGGSTRALMALAAEVIAAVQRVFSVNLEPEPVLWGEP